MSVGVELGSLAAAVSRREGETSYTIQWLIASFRHKVWCHQHPRPLLPGIPVVMVSASVTRIFLPFPCTSPSRGLHNLLFWAKGRPIPIHLPALLCHCTLPQGTVHPPFLPSRVCGQGWEALGLLLDSLGTLPAAMGGTSSKPLSRGHPYCLCTRPTHHHLPLLGMDIPRCRTCSMEPRIMTLPLPMCRTPIRISYPDPRPFKSH